MYSDIDVSEEALRPCLGQKNKPRVEKAAKISGEVGYDYGQGPGLLLTLLIVVKVHGISVFSYVRILN